MDQEKVDLYAGTHKIKWYLKCLLNHVYDITQLFGDICPRCTPLKHTVRIVWHGTTYGTFYNKLKVKQLQKVINNCQ